MRAAGRGGHFVTMEIVVPSHFRGITRVDTVSQLCAAGASTVGSRSGQGERRVSRGVAHPVIQGERP